MKQYFEIIYIIEILSINKIIWIKKSFINNCYPYVKYILKLYNYFSYYFNINLNK